MYSKFIIFLIFLSFFNLASAAQKNPQEEGIPFQIYKTKITYYPAQETSTKQCTHDNACMKQMSFCMRVSDFLNTDLAIIENSQSTKLIQPDEIKSTITQLKKTICSVAEDADVKVWLSGDMGGKLIVSVSVQSGIEVTFHCKNH